MCEHVNTVNTLRGEEKKMDLTNMIQNSQDVWFQRIAEELLMIY